MAKAKGARNVDGKALRPKANRPNTTSTVGKPLGGSSKKLAFSRVYHGTSQESARGIRSVGHNISKYGSFGPGVYATSSKTAAREYANWRAKGGKDRFGESFAASKVGPAILAYRVPRRKIRTDADHGGNLKGYERGDWVAGGGARRTKAMDGRSDVVIMAKGLADKSLIKSRGTITRRRRRKTA
jgi:hypothetical protein